MSDCLDMCSMCEEKEDGIVEGYKKGRVGERRRILCVIRNFIKNDEGGLNYYEKLREEIRKKKKK